MNTNRIKTAFYYLLAIIFIAICIGCFSLGRNSVDMPEIIAETKWDTVTIEKPVPYNAEKVRTEYVYIHTPADTVVIERVDSVLAAVDIERRVYQDSSFRATISGPRIGEFRPILEDIEIYSKTNTVVMERPVRFIRPYVSACGGKAILGIGGGVRINERVDIGAKYLRMNQKDAWVIETNIVF